MSSYSDYLLQAQKFHERQYEALGPDFQRHFASEDVVRFVRKYFKESQAVSVLDMGAALGGNTKALVSLMPQANIVASDFCSYSVSFIRDLNLPKVIPTYCFFPDTSQLAQFSFSAVIDHMCSYSLKQSDFAAFLGSLGPQLKTGALYYLKTLSKGSDLYLNVPEEDRDGRHTIRRVSRPTSPFPGDDYSFTFYTFEELDGLFSEAGFRQVAKERLVRTYRNTEEVFEQLEMVYEWAGREYS